MTTERTALDAAWEALSEALDFWVGMVSPSREWKGYLLTRHRPHIEAAIRAESGHKASDHDGCDPESCEVEALVRSLVARAVRAESGALDVGRLARALHNAPMWASMDGGHQGRCLGIRSDHEDVERKQAAILAAEYARLTEADR